MISEMLSGLSHIGASWLMFEHYRVMLRISDKPSIGKEGLFLWMRLGLNNGRRYCYSTSCKCNKQTKNTWHNWWPFKSFKQHQESIQHSRVKDLKYNIPSDCWSEYSGVKGRWERREQTGGGRYQKKNREGGSKIVSGEKRLMGKGKRGLYKNTVQHEKQDTLH